MTTGRPSFVANDHREAAAEWATNERFNELLVVEATRLETSTPELKRAHEARKKAGMMARRRVRGRDGERRCV